MSQTARVMRFASLFLTFVFAATIGVRADSVGLQNLEIETSSGSHKLSVEIMTTPDQLERGLMFRKYMPEDRGMLFDFKVEAPIMMWMKNTYISLDMIFINKDGVVTGVAENAEPLSEAIIPSNGPIQAVLEINAGVAAKLGVKKGDTIRSPVLAK